jgi:Small metal-binding protein
MKYKNTLAALVVGTLTVFGVGAYAQQSVAPESPHEAEAVKHAKEAVAAGKKGDAAVLVEHAEEAKKHAIMAQKDFSSFNLQSAATHLDEAITAGKAGDAKVATTHVEEALKVLASGAPQDPNQP